VYKELKDLRIFEEIERLADEIWDEVSPWDNLAKFSIGSQLVNAIDSVAANIEEADDRYHVRDKLNFIYIGRGSLKEARRWITKAQKRKLWTSDNSQGFLARIENILPQYNAFITDFKKRTKSSLSQSS
jgi:four helix bundle protein